jgi:formate-dependent nitrite reductase cytochrome c552 subunit
VRPTAPTAPIVSASSHKQLSAEVQKKIKVLRKKVKDIEILEERLAEGAILQANQKEKIAGKDELTEALRQLTM